MMIRASASRLVGAVLAVIVSMTGAPLIAQLPDQPEHRWEGTYRAQVPDERSGVLEIVSGRVVFREAPPFGLWTWTFPLRELGTVKADGAWVEIEVKRPRSLTDIKPRFRPRQGSATQLAAEIGRLLRDPAILAAGSGLASIRGVMAPRTSILVMRFDDAPVWTSETGRLIRPSSPGGFRLVGAELEFAPGFHRLSMVVPGTDVDASCTLEFHARADRVYELSKGARNVPVLKDVTSGESSPGRCLEPSPEDEILATLGLFEMGATVHEVDGWTPWVNLDQRRLRNPAVGPKGSRWIKGQVRLPSGPHILAVGYKYDGWVSLGSCVFGFTAEPSEQYLPRGDILGRIPGTPNRAWRALLHDSKKRTVADCPSGNASQKPEPSDKK
jgi:hypothetical protein